MKTLGIYIHIPFCEAKCDYCNFVSFRQSDQVKEKYVDYLIREIALSAPLYADYLVDTIYIGGGTPSCLREKSIKTILNFVENNFNLASDAEITIEGNPNSLSLEKLREFKLAGINRLSVGLQAYNDKLLKSIGRIHTKKQFDSCIKNAKIVGFDNISADILLGLPQQSIFSVMHELKHLMRLKIQHISAYGLIVEQNTKLFDKLQKGEVVLPSEQKSLRMYNKTLKFLKKHKFFRYEVSNFCLKGFESKHNTKYWNMCEYVGFGISAHSFFDGYRWENTSVLNDYFAILDKNLLPQLNRQKQTTDDLKMEHIMTSLRQEVGLNLQVFEKLYGQNLLDEKKQQISLLLSNNLIKIENNFLKATDKGFEVLNQIILELV